MYIYFILPQSVLKPIMSNNRFASLKTKPTNTFKSGSGRSRPSLNNDSKKGFGSSYKSDLDSAFSSNKKKYSFPIKENPVYAASLAECLKF